MATMTFEDLDPRTRQAFERIFVTESEKQAKQLDAYKRLEAEGGFQDYFGRTHKPKDRGNEQAA